jgi:hypothetical protein
VRSHCVIDSEAWPALLQRARAAKMAVTTVGCGEPPPQFAAPEGYCEFPAHAPPPPPSHTYRPLAHCADTVTGVVLYAAVEELAKLLRHVRDKKMTSGARGNDVSAW